MDSYTIIKTSFGIFRLSDNGFAITGLVRLPDSSSIESEKRAGSFGASAVDALQEYFSGCRRTFFEYPILFHGTMFQEKVWHALIEIPWGQAKTYGQIAKEIGCPGGARAVGQAVHCNPILILIPCHRVLAADGIGGFGSGIDLKKKLLQLEHVRICDH